jgi:hypothetical protein
MRIRVYINGAICRLYSSIAFPRGGGVSGVELCSTPGRRFCVRGTPHDYRLRTGAGRRAEEYKKRAPGVSTGARLYTIYNVYALLRIVGSNLTSSQRIGLILRPAAARITVTRSRRIFTSIPSLRRAAVKLPGARRSVTVIQFKGILPQPSAAVKSFFRYFYDYISIFSIMFLNTDSLSRN